MNKLQIVLVVFFLWNELIIGGISVPSIVPNGNQAQSQGVSSGGGDSSSGGPPQPISTGAVSGTFNVKDHGARADGKSDDSKAIEAAWKAACDSSGSPKLWIPQGNYLTGPIRFTGPCKNTNSITIQMEGTLLASTNLGLYKDDWITFGWLNGLTLTGGGTFDGQGAASWSQNKCPKTKNCKLLPTTLKFNAMTNTTVRGIKSLNSKLFHFGLINSQKFDIIGVTITAPEESPNTDGIHIERCSGVTIADSNIGTGDDCVSIGHGNSHITVTGVNCGPGHGISVGSLGKYQNEEDVTGLLVKNCTLTETMNGVRIKSWENSPGATVASNMTFENIVMNNVSNPIIIDQTYCPFASCDGKAPSRVKLHDITFRNIRGTSATPVAVTLECSKGIPCSNVVLEDIQLDPSAGGPKATTMCQNVQAKYIGTQVPAPCT